VTFVLDSLPRLVEGSSYGDWKASGRAPKDGTFVEAGWNQCGADIAESALGGNRTMRRVAAFYIPPAPSPLQLPDRPPSDVLAQCRFGVAWADVSELTEQRASLLEAATAKSMEATFGPGSSSGVLRIAPPWPAVVGWQYTTFWTRDTVTLVSGVTYRPRWRVRTDTPSAFLAAAGAVSGDDTTPRQMSDSESGIYPATLARVEEALVLTQVQGGPADAIRTVLPRVAAADGSLLFPPDDEKLRVYAAVARWVRATADIPASRRAAALVAADHIVSMAGEIPGRDYESVRALETLGARFDWVELGNAWVPTHEWLKQAWELDRGGRAGEIAFQALMETGFGTEGQCGAHREDFRTVLARGEAFLREFPDSRIRRDVHLMMARAAATIVALAAGWDGATPGTAKARYGRESAAARARALGHYRAFFEAEPERARAERVWPEAFRLAAGLTPTRPHFWCLGD
jgi:hypothetical protein